ncbi:Non-specific lipid-transfer protein 6 [Apostasia shenzhenica]|uniref:Non-specific lipid-transfer protein n=1 Tax=Apostasia shenzhenica TaxID=1088818 RepID=A0A2I0A4U8_9ASPA|nr:Non-specific lipid-transfer protein 6 [Apostasia shenzhenica]
MPRASAAAMVAIVVVATLTSPPAGEALLTCPEVIGGYFLACLLYLQSGGPIPSACCRGLTNLLAAAQATVDRRAACSCLEMAVRGATEEVLRRAGLLPDRCNLSLPFVISPSTDCSL